MNKVVLIGRLTKEPELKFTPGKGTAVCTLTLAIDRRVANKDGQREADFIPIIVWGKQAEAVANYSGKGKMIGVAGRIQTRSYDNKEGRKVFVTEVISEDVQILEWANSRSNSSSSNSYDDAMEEVEDSGDIPF